MALIQSVPDTQRVSHDARPMPANVQLMGVENPGSDVAAAEFSDDCAHDMHRSTHGMPSVR